MWIVHPIAGLLLVMYAGVVWQKGHDGNRRAIILAVLMLMLTVLGAGWVVHPAAGITLAACFAFAGGNILKKHSNHGLRVLATAAAFGVFGAGWVFIPLVVATAISLMNGSKSTKPKGKAVANSWPPPLAWPVTQPVPQAFSHMGAQPMPQPQNLTVLSQHPRLPSDSAKRAKALNLQCFEALAYIDERGPAGDKLRFEVEQIQHDFAVEAIGAYLALSPARADTSPLRDGRTGQDLLNEQLDLLSDGVHAVMERAEELGAEQILASHAFVSQKFAQQKTSELQL